MTIKGLLEILTHFPSDMEVIVDGYEEGYEPLQGENILVLCKDFGDIKYYLSDAAKRGGEVSFGSQTARLGDKKYFFRLPVYEKLIGFDRDTTVLNPHLLPDKLLGRFNEQGA